MYNNIIEMTNQRKIENGSAAEKARQMAANMRRQSWHHKMAAMKLAASMKIGGVNSGGSENSKKTRE